MIHKISAAIAVAMIVAPAAAWAADKADDIVVSSAEGQQMRRIHVSVTDLDLKSAQGVRVADARIDKAARVVCAWATGTVLPETQEYRTCYSAAVNNANGPRANDMLAMLN